MLLAEIHGKTVPEARDSEDYLTSTIFGHLRYVPPGPFWDNLLKRARGLPQSDKQEPLLGQVLASHGQMPSSYDRLEVHFWKSNPKHEEPDLLLVFKTEDRLPLVLLIEAKLWSDKSGTDDFDQLVRYLRILEDLDTVGIHVPDGTARYLIYLTPRESLVEVQASARGVDDPARDRPRLFRLQWQDVLDAAWEIVSQKSIPEPARTILADVVCFLRTLGLEYFKGMSRLGELPFLEAGYGAFYTANSTGFRGITREPGLQFFEIRKGNWT